MKIRLKKSGKVREFCQDMWVGTLNLLFQVIDIDKHPITNIVTTRKAPINQTHYILFTIVYLSRACSLCDANEDNCFNVRSDQQCDDWEGEDQCVQNPQWMYANCRKTCSKCDYGTGRNLRYFNYHGSLGEISSWIVKIKTQDHFIESSFVFINSIQSKAPHQSRTLMFRR